MATLLAGLAPVLALAEAAEAIPVRANVASPVAPRIATLRRDRVNDVMCDLSRGLRVGDRDGRPGSGALGRD